MDGVVRVTSILNQYLATLPEDKENVGPVQKIVSGIELAVDFRESESEVGEREAVLA